MRFAAICCLMLLPFVSHAWAGDGCGQCSPQKCHQPCQTVCTDVFNCCPEPAQKCEPSCPFGMEALFAPITEIPVIDEGSWEIDLACCERQEFRFLPCREWCIDYTYCCPREEFRLLCQPECECVCEPPKKKCQQNLCTPRPGCDCSGGG